ncbi:MAG: hypothetical protein QOC92_4271 [Acidimicrobiaceae bacterium]
MTRAAAEDTRTLLVDTAITLWAARGMDAVSLREIGLAAGQKNTGVINYYFGDREGLVRAVVERFAELHPDFEQMAAGFLPPRTPATARQVAGALVRPFGALLEEAPDYVQLIARFFADFGRSDALTQLAAARWFAKVEDLVRVRFGLEPSSARWQFAITLTVHAIAEHARQTQRHKSPPSPVFIEDLVDAVAGILSSKRTAHSALSSASGS